MFKSQVRYEAGPLQREDDEDVAEIARLSVYVCMVTW